MLMYHLFWDVNTKHFAIPIFHFFQCSRKSSPRTKSNFKDIVIGLYIQVLNNYIFQTWVGLNKESLWNKINTKIDHDLLSSQG